MPQLGWESGKGANLCGKFNAVSSSEAMYQCSWQVFSKEGIGVVNY